MAALGRRKSGGRSPPAAINARAVDWTPPPRDRMTCESVISAMVGGQAASLFGQMVDGLGRPGGTLDGEDGGDAVPVEHDAVGLLCGCQRGLDFLDVDLPGNDIVHAGGLFSGHPGWMRGALGRGG